jgi:hypothetical protein
MRDALGRFGSNCSKPVAHPLHAISAEGLAEEFADVTALLIGDGNDLFGQILGEADGEDTGGARAGGIHGEIITYYDIVVQQKMRIALHRNKSVSFAKQRQHVGRATRALASSQVSSGIARSSFMLRGSETLVGDYSKTRVAVPKGNTLKWLFPQEKATFEALIKGTFTLVLL